MERAAETAQVRPFRRRSALAQSAEALEQQLSEHQRILSLALKEGNGREIELPSYASNSEPGKFRWMLLEAIEVLDVTSITRDRILNPAALGIGSKE